MFEFACSYLAKSRSLIMSRVSDLLEHVLVNFFEDNDDKRNGLMRNYPLIHLFSKKCA